MQLRFSLQIMNDWSLEEIAKKAAAITAVAATLAGIWKYGGKRFWTWLKNYLGPRWRVFNRVKKLEEIANTNKATLEEIKDSLGVILTEVQTNGAGHSLREALRREVENRWRDYEINGKAVWSSQIDSNGEVVCIRATSALTEMVGQSPLGKGWMNAIHPDDLDDVSEAWDKANELRTPYDFPQRFLHRKNGKVVRTVYVRAYFLPEFNELGEFIGGHGQCTEITAERYHDMFSD